MDNLYKMMFHSVLIQYIHVVMDMNTYSLRASYFTNRFEYL